jgi:tetratricopeptide (TPR) repeat protein
VSGESAAARRARALDDEAMAHARAGRLARALPLWGEALRLAPDDVDVLVHFGHGLGAAGEHQKGAELATLAAQRAPDSAAPWLLLGQLARDAGQPARALEAFALAQARAQGAAAVDVAVAIAQTLCGLERYDDADRALAGVVADRVDVCVVRALVAAAAGDGDGAHAFLTRAAEIDPLHPEPFKRLAMLVGARDRALGLELAQHAVELAPHDDEAKAVRDALRS